MEGEDRISSLPLDVIVSILSNLEVKDAIRTSVLSRSWRHFWTYLPSLRIGRFIDDDDADFSEIEPVASSWIEGVHHVVSSLRGPLLHFALSQYFSSASGQSALLKSLLDLLLHKGCIETLQLKSRFDRVFIKLPSFHSLKQLELYRCYLVLPVDFQGFHCLSSLTLCTVQISNDDLHLLIHTSNKLTTFKGGFFVPLGVQPVSIKLNSPSLNYLEHIIDSSNEKVEVVSAPYLEQAKIGNGALINFENSASSNLGLVTSTAATVSSLYLDFCVLESLSFAALPLNSTFPRVRQLNLVLDIGTMDKTVYDTFIWLLRSMLCLEELNVELNDYYDINEVDILMRELLLKKHNGLSCLDQTLKRVRIGTENLDSVLTGITLVKFFLLNARVLELMKVSYWTDSKVKPSMIEKELQKAKVSSSKAKVVIIPSERTM
ncbi:hypothetical protein LUZ63_003971 [Rhynchospora breviuscula]|uniref:F-box domain-containing protein n=1 Tax=Rhynchospora breviuscula TaxID=2022672 RepID=A0A9Q0D1N5_9POAL|nr:hypothetical protein LUZ63_003971 [Rhynchospora breviuscula]